MISPGEPWAEPYEPRRACPLCAEPLVCVGYEDVVPGFRTWHYAVPCGCYRGFASNDLLPAKTKPRKASAKRLVALHKEGPAFAQPASAYTVGSLFSGQDGIGLAFEQAGWRVRWQVEKNPFRRRVLALRFPRSTIFEDVFDVGRHNLKPVTALVGGFPCTPVSGAGKRKGTADERWLWPEFARIIGELRPRIVFLENADEICAPIRVDGRIVAPAPALTVLGDLAALRYDATWGIVPAAAAGAPHQRDRWWCVAYTDCYQRPAGGEQYQQRREATSAYADRPVPDADEIGRGRQAATAVPVPDVPYPERNAALSGEIWRNELCEIVSGNSGVAQGDPYPQRRPANNTGTESNAATQFRSTGAVVRFNLRDAERSRLQGPDSQKLEAAAQFAQRPEGQQVNEAGKPDLGRVVFNGLSRRLEQLASTERWAAPLGLRPYPFEPDRFTDDTTDWKDRIEALGDSVCVPVVRAFAAAIREALAAPTP